MALTSMSVVEDDISTEVFFNGGLTTAYTHDSITGVSAVGHALHNVEDVYDWTVGYDLAVSRSKARLYNKIVKELVKQTK